MMEAQDGLVTEAAVTPRDRPLLEFEVRNVTPIAHAAAPTLRFELAIDEGSEREIFAIALSVSIEIEPAQRRYDPETRERLVELLGDPARIGAPTRTMHWTRLGVLVPAFSGSTTVGVDVLCNYDLEVGATSYFHTVTDGEVPLAFNFNGGVYYQGDDGRLQIVQVDWDSHASYRMPVEAWKRMIAMHYPFRDWVALHTETLEALRRRRAELGLPTFDATVAELLREARDAG